MSITTVQLLHRIGRRARGGDFTKLSLTEVTDLLDAANAALQRLYNALPTYFKEQTEGFVLPGPLAVSGVGVTQYGKTVTGIAFTEAQFGQSIVLDGDAGWNQIIGTAELLNPYMGDTASVSGTIYGNAIHSTTVPLDRIVGDPMFANPGLAPFFRATIGGGAPQSFAWWPWMQTIGIPQQWWPQVYGNAQGHTPIMTLKFAPAPSSPYAINVRIAFWPMRLTIADINANTSLGVPDQFIEPSLIPMALQSFLSSPIWEVRGDEQRIEESGLRGEDFARKQYGQIGAPNNRVYTPAGF
jgi:hypothetical protein